MTRFASQASQRAGWDILPACFTQQMRSLIQNTAATLGDDDTP
ncbi:hypothetical protein HMPREF9371_1538 [Neisseria shayeganii 871]|uniref:Uncharacterized protein n=1 Tax=Neisseria shayeganii 871 TaxID=1032488 RepID=G4CIU9_9NEIS|nr:hypothetical protein HMPREF9371_1538 [Neisseria shayeganii 871]